MFRYRNCIEVIGLPGSGKSTLVRRLAQVPATPVTLPPLRPSRRALLRAAARLVGTGLASSPRTILPLLLSRDGCWLVAKLAYRSAALSSRATSGALMQDSGVLQPLVSFAAEYRTGPDPELRPLELLPLLSLPRVALYVRVPPETALERYKRRQMETGRRPEASVCIEGFGEAYAACEAIAGFYAKQAERKLIVVDNLQAPRDEEISAIAGTLSTILAGGQ